MAKGFFTQSAMVLFERPVSLEAVAACLDPFDVVKRNEASEAPWMGGPSVLLPMRPEVNGYALVDLIDRAWPDNMGDPKVDVDLFSAWSMGFFGPLVFPQNLARAQAMSFTWKGASEIVSRHRAFVRIRSSYALGAADDAPILPEGVDPVTELQYVTTVARALLRLPGALAYFNPNGEVLRSCDGLDEELVWCKERDLPPLPIWTNVRLFRLDSAWSLMDTVGMEQLDVDDHEACFRPDVYEPGAVGRFLRSTSNYIFKSGPVIAPGDTMDGPGGVRWQAHPIAQSLAPRPRRVLRWLPMDGTVPPR